MPSKVFRYCDDVRTGVYDIDSMSVYVDFDLLQKILRMDEQTLTEEAGGGKLPPRTTQVQIKLKPSVAANKDAAGRGVECVGDLLWLLPLGYEDRRLVVPLAQLADLVPEGRGGRRVRRADRTGYTQWSSCVRILKWPATADSRFRRNSRGGNLWTRPCPIGAADSRFAKPEGTHRRYTA